MADENSVLSMMCQALPWWVAWGNVLFFVPFAMGLAFSSWKLATSFLLRPLQKTKNSSWTERARLLYPARRMGQILLYGFTIFSASLASWYGGPCSVVSSKVLSLTTLMAIFFLLRYLQLKWEFRLLDVKIEGPLDILKTVLANSLLFFLLSVVFLTLLFMPEEWNGRFYFMAGGVVLFLAVYSLFGFFLFMKICGLFTKPPDKLVRAIENATRKTGIIPRKVFVFKSLYANAYALPHLRSVFFTDRAVSHLCEEELSSIALHEYGHLMEPSYKWGMRFVPLLFLLPLIVLRPLATSHYFVWLGIAALFFFVVLFVRFFSRRMEEKADAVANLHKDEEGPFARSLEKIYQLNLMPAVTGKRISSHPDLYDRLLASGSTPTYPKPKRPPRARFYVALLFFFFLPLGLLSLPKSYLLDQYDAHWDDEGFIHTLLTMSDKSYLLDALAQIEHNKGNKEKALFIYQACTVLDKESADCPAKSAVFLLQLDRCAEALKMYDEATQRLQRLKEKYDYDDKSIDMFLKDIRPFLETCHDKIKT